MIPRPDPEVCSAGVQQPDRCRAGRLPRAILILLCSASAVIAAAPRMRVEDPISDFGAVTDDRPVEHVFMIENAGDEPLVIRRITADCEKCVSFSLPRYTIPPGSIEIDGFWQTFSCQSFASCG